MDPITTGILVGGTVLSAFGSLSSARAQSKAAKRQARAKREQAKEMLKRAKFNAAVMREQGRGLQAEQVAAFAKSGVALTSGSTLATLQDTVTKVSLSVQQMLDEADFKAQQLRMGANIDTRLAGDIKTAGGFQAAGTLLGGIGTVGMYGGFSAPSSASQATIGTPKAP